MKIENFESRLAAKRVAIDQAEFEEKMRLKKEFDEAHDKAMVLMPEVKEVLDMAKKIYEMKFVIPRDNIGFFSDGVSHKFGFMGIRNDTAPAAVGWYNGGCCGQYNIFCDGEYIVARHVKDNYALRKVITEEYNLFAERWLKFRDRFFDWVENELLKDVNA